MVAEGVGGRRGRAAPPTTSRRADRRGIPRARPAPRRPPRAIATAPPPRRAGVPGQERVVGRIDQQGGAPDALEVGPAARPAPVVALVGEAVQRRGEPPVVLGEGARAQHRGHVDPAVVEVGLGPDLGLHGAQEAPGVDRAVEAAVEHRGTGGQVERGRDGDRPRHRAGRGVALLPEPLQHHVAAQRDPDQADPGIALALPQLLEHPLEIPGLARVIEPRQAVHLPAARAEVHHRGAAAEAARPAQQAARVVRARRALEAVEDQDQRAGLGGPGQPVEIDEVAVGGLEALPAQRGPPPVSQQRPPQRLQMPAPVPERRAVGGVVWHSGGGHPSSASGLVRGVWL